MAFTLPSISLEADALEGLTIPQLVLDASELTGVTLPTLILDASTLTTGINLPPIYLTEDAPSTLTYVASGGVVLSGGADIVGEPYAATGGVRVGGEADVDATSVSISEFYPRGGARATGAAAVVFDFVEFKPSGGVRVSGAAANTMKTPLHTPSGGVQVSGEAKDPLVVMTGGVSVSGEADVVSIQILVVTPSGGVQVSGGATAASALLITPSGGVQASGAAAVLSKSPVHVPEGGVELSGAAVSVFIPSGYVITPENPLVDVFTGWAINYMTSAASRYEDLPITSMCRFKGKTYATTAAGIYEYGADDDAGQPIKASITIAKSDFGQKFNKRVPYVYLGYKSDSNMRVSIVTNEQTASYYDLQMPEAGSRGARAKTGRGLEGLYWSFRVDNKDGAFFELDTLKIEYTLLRKMGV
jgi:hypothetical protein